MTSCWVDLGRAFVLVEMDGEVPVASAQEQPIVKLFIKGMDVLCLLRTYLLNLLNTQARLCLFRN